MRQARASTARPFKKNNTYNGQSDGSVEAGTVRGGVLAPEYQASNNAAHSTTTDENAGRHGTSGGIDGIGLVEG